MAIKSQVNNARHWLQGHWAVVFILQNWACIAFCVFDLFRAPNYYWLTENGSMNNFVVD